MPYTAPSPHKACRHQHVGNSATSPETQLSFSLCTVQSLRLIVSPNSPLGYPTSNRRHARWSERHRIAEMRSAARHVLVPLLTLPQPAKRV
ncbi:hypothetical protein WJX72_004465 [[Myrmecia] bisecta]|uniref:Uncharacterized protein n=1 Tax=[Myrmecia] bisecta TaxID=41462 RepID=A0AAW1QQG2_9CHLO